MLFRSFAVASTAALCAQAFLLPPHISDTDIDDINFGAAVINPSERVVKVDCPGCYFQKKGEDGQYKWVENVANSLVLNFSVAHENPEFLQLNGVRIYPDAGRLPQPISAYQVESSVSLVDFKAITEEREGLALGYELAIAPKPENSNLISLHFKVLELNNVFVTGLDSVEMTILKLDDKLMIATVDLTPTTRLGTSPSETEKAGEEKECTSFPLLCKWKSILREKLGKMKGSIKGCGKSAVRPEPTDHVVHPDEHSNAGVPPSHEEHPHHDYHKKHRTGFAKFTHVLKSIAIHVLAPVLVGIVAGMAGCLLGLVVGQFCVCVWRLLYRGGKRGQYTSVQQEDSESRESVDEEQKDLLDDRDLPEYEEVVGTNTAVEKE